MVERDVGAMKSPFWKLILRELGNSKRSLFLAVSAMIAMVLTQIVRPWPLKIIFDYVLLERPVPPAFQFAASLLESDKTKAVVLVSCSLIVIACLKGMFAYVETYQTARIGNQLAFILRTKLFAHMQSLSLAFHSQSRTGELLTKIGSDTGTVKAFFSDSALALASHAITIVCTFAVMFIMNWKLAMVVLATFPLLVATIAFLHRQASRAQRAQRKKLDAITSRISEALSSVHLIQAFARESHEQGKFDSENDEYLEHSLRNARIESAAARAVELTSAIGTCAVVLYGSLLVIDGSMSPGTILVFSSYLHGLYRPIRRLVKQTVRLSRLQVSIERISEILSVDQDIKEKSDAIEATSIQGEVEFRNVTFAYAADSADVLSDVSFRLRPGKRIAVVGASGAGKSTLIGLLLRLFDPKHGAVLLDGVDLRDYKIDSLRNQISVVLQDSLLQGTTVAENIAYGNLHASRDDVVEAARLAHADEFIRQMPDGYDSIIGGRGATLSGGQQRRIAIARALVRNAQILILDEPMTGLDLESELRVSRGLEHLMERKTCLLITHDLTAAAEFDEVIVLDDGKIVASGPPTTLFDHFLQVRSGNGKPSLRTNGSTA